MFIDNFYILPLIFTSDDIYYHIFVRNTYLFGRVITGFAMPCVVDVIGTRKQTWQTRKHKRNRYSRDEEYQ